MIDKRDVIAFFDKRAAAWDAEMIRHEPVIQAILDNAGVGDGARVLDVACGTGVLFPDYLARGASVTGIDISPEMARIAAAKFTGEPRVQVLCGDVEETVFPETFDVVMVYNAFPHFPDPARLMARRQIRRLPVVAEGKVVGMVSLGDLAQCGRYEMEISRALTDISSVVQKLSE